jgi:hypothetical protein
VPYDDPDFDPPVRGIVAELNRFPGLHTFGSCGGHGDRGRPLDDPNIWYVHFYLEPNDVDSDVANPSPGAWMDLELLAYAINYRIGIDRNVRLLPYANPPHINEPGRMLSWEVQGGRDGDDGIEPDELVTLLREILTETEYGPLERPA